MASSDPLSVLIAGGGVAALEALLALSHLAGDRVEITLLAPEPDFVLTPMTVVEPFGGPPAEHRALAPVAAEHGATLVTGRLAEIDAPAHRAVLEDGQALPYDALVVAVGAPRRPAFSSGITFPGPGASEAIGALMADAAAGRAGDVA